LFRHIHGVDFSGAKLAGRTTWVARIVPAAWANGEARYTLTELHRLEDLCGTPERGPALAHLVSMIAESDAALWAMDFPFGLPVELMDSGDGWPAQLDLVTGWEGGGYGLGLELLRRAKALGGANHLRRLTDVELKAPFDPYHYRIIYQTFHGMRDVLAALHRTEGTAILPFDYAALPRARRVLVEACPSSTLKRLGLPHQNYKQPQGNPPDAKRRRTRRAILERLDETVWITGKRRRILMSDGGGDALDAVLAAVGGIGSWLAADHDAIARHPRYPREGRMYV
jgi:hypothetical protein